MWPVGPETGGGQGARPSWASNGDGVGVGNDNREEEAEEGEMEEEKEEGELPSRIFS